MSVETNVFLRTDRFPTITDWANATRTAGFPLDIPATFDPGQGEAALELLYDGATTSILYRREQLLAATLLERAHLDEHDVEQLDGRLLRVSLISDSWRGLMSSMAAAASLAELSNGLLCEAGLPPFILPERAIEWAQACRRTVESGFIHDRFPQ